MLGGIGEKRVVCIDWDDWSVRVVQALLSKRGVQVQRAFSESLDAGVDITNSAALGAFLRRALAKHRVRGDRVTIAVPRQNAVLNTLTLPPTKPDELPSIVHFQIGKELLFPKEQAVIDFAVGATDAASGEVEVLVAAVRSEVVEQYKEVMAAAGLKLERIGLRPYANMVAVTGDEREAAVPGRTVVVDVGPHLTEIDVIRDGRLAFSRAASVTVPKSDEEPAKPVDGDEPSQAAAAEGDAATDEPWTAGAVEDLLVELTRTFEAYRATDPGSNMDRAIISGATGIESVLAETVADRFGVPTQLFEPSTLLRWHRAVSESMTGFAAVLGLALGQRRGSTLYFDFLHPKQPVNVRRQRMRRVPLVAATIAIFLAAGLVAWGQVISKRQGRLDAVDAELKVEKERKKTFDEFMDKLEEARKWESDEVVWLDVLRKVAAAFPGNEQAYVNEINFRDNGEIVLKFVARDEQVAPEFARRLSVMQGKDGKTLFKAEPGTAFKNADERYKTRTEVQIRLTSKADKKESSKKKRK